MACGLARSPQLSDQHRVLMPLSGREDSRCQRSLENIWAPVDVRRHPFAATTNAELALIDHPGWLLAIRYGQVLAWGQYAIPGLVCAAALIPGLDVNPVRGAEPAVPHL